MQEQRRSVYEDDVQLQMDSKLWGEKYSKQNPPKKVSESIIMYSNYGSCVPIEF